MTAAGRDWLVTVLLAVLVVAPIAGASTVVGVGTAGVEGGGDVSAPASARADAPNVSRGGTAAGNGDNSVLFVEPDETRVETIAHEPNYTVAFWSGPFTPDPGLDPAVTDTRGERTWVLVQFRASPYGSTLDALAEDGYRDVGRLSATTRYAEIPVDRAEAIADREAVRAVARVRPAWKLRPSFERELAARPADAPIRVALQTFANLSTARVDELGLTPVDVDEAGTTTYYGQLTPEEVRGLRDSPRVMWIEGRTPPVSHVSEGRRLVGAHMAGQPGPGGRGGYTGQGVRVGVVDTGLEHGHPHFDSVNVVDAKDWWGGRFSSSDAVSDPPANCDHGTHVAGTIAGRGLDQRRNLLMRGVAPDATLVPSNVFRPEDRDPTEDDCEWVKKPVGLKKIFNKVDNRNVDVISNSWGDDTDGNYDIRASWVDTWARNNPGVLLVFSNGNSGDTSHVSTPAVAKNVISVGAIRDGSRRSDGNLSDGSIARVNTDSSLNNIAPPTDVRRGSGRRKPDLYAPGHRITAPVLNGRYGGKRGTSMAAPHVSGVAALLKEKYPSMGANQLRAELIGTAVEPRYDGYGIVNANNALFPNAYESRHAHMSGTVRKHRGATLTEKAKRKKKRVENDVKSFGVSADAEKLVVTLTWLDPGNLVSSRSDRLANDLDLVVDGPDGERKVTTDSNVKQVVVEDPSPGQWTITVHAREVTALTSQDYDVVYRTVTAEPTLSVEDSKTITVEPWESRNQQFTVDVNGTGAPVSGISLDADRGDLRRLSWCDGFRDESVVGILSQDHGYRETGCVEVPSTNRMRSFDVNVSVNTSNAARIDGAPTRNATRTVTFEVLPNPDPDRFDRGGDNDDQSSAADLTAASRWDHSHLRCVGGGRFSGGRSAGDDCSAILSGGSVAAANEFWNATVADLSLHDDGDADFYNLSLPSTDTPSLPNPECGSQQVRAGGDTYEVKTDGTLIVRAVPTNNSLGSAGVRTNDSAIQLTVYDDGRRVTAGTTSHGEYGVRREIPCPRNEGLDEFTVSFDEGPVRNAGSYQLEVWYAVDLTRPEKVREIQLDMALDAAGAERVEGTQLAFNTLPLDPDFDRRMEEGFRCPGTYLCGNRPEPVAGLVENERVLVHVRNPRGEITNRYFVVVEGGEVTSVRPVTDPGSVRQSIDAYTDTTTARWIVDSGDKMQAIGSAYHHGRFRIYGNGMLDTVRISTIKFGIGVVSAVTGFFDAVGGFVP